MTTSDQHWNDLFSNYSDTELGWYEADSSQTLKFLDVIPNLDKATVFLPGAGKSILVDALLPRCSHLVLNDISDEALMKLRKRIGAHDSKITWLHHDISKPVPTSTPTANVWIDRAVLHFLLEERDIQSYFDNLHSFLSAEGFVLLAEFAYDGAPQCAGLNLHRYTVEEMTARMGPGFSLLCDEKYTFINPSGDPRPYIYAFYKRVRYSK